jgi:hypothetical protein
VGPPGPGASLRCGLAALPPACEAAIVVLADGPDIAPAAIDRVVATWRARDGEVLAASYDGNRSHPVLLARSVWQSIPDEGARALEATLVACDDLGAPGDVDTPEQLPTRLRAVAPAATGAAAGSPLAQARIRGTFTLEQAALRAGIAADEARWLEEGRLYRFPDADAAIAATIAYATALGLPREGAGEQKRAGSHDMSRRRLIVLTALALLAIGIAVAITAATLGR